MRILGWTLAGLFLGLIIHLVVILALPQFIENRNYQKLIDLGGKEDVILLAVPDIGQPNPFGLDPAFAYAACWFDLTDGPASVTGLLPDDFWSVAVYDGQDGVLYGTTNRAGIGQILQLGIFNPSQTRLLAERKLEITDGLLIVEASENRTFVVVRLLLPYPEYRSRYEAQLQQISCTHISQSAQ